MPVVQRDDGTQSIGWHDDAAVVPLYLTFAELPDSADEARNG
jgi:hypothetical protein